MDLGKKVFAKQSGIGIYLYPHNKQLEDATLCSIFSEKRKWIFHVPYSAISSYKFHCWYCGNNTLDSFTDKTCPNCHWLICPNCGSCHDGGCVNDRITILDTMAPDEFESYTGMEVYDFWHEHCYYFESFDEYHEYLYEHKQLDENRPYCYLGHADVHEFERCFLALYDRIPQSNFIIEINDKGRLSLYVNTASVEVALLILEEIGAKLSAPIGIFEAFDPADYLDDDCSDGFDREFWDSIDNMLEK